MMSAAWGLGGATALGTMLVFPADPSMLALARQETAPGLVATLVDGVLLLRLRADQGETVRGEFERIWRALRPRLTGLAALAPRIWAT
jgi:urease accessory protein UreH